MEKNKIIKKCFVTSKPFLGSSEYFSQDTASMRLGRTVRTVHTSGQTSNKQKISQSERLKQDVTFWSWTDERQCLSASGDYCTITTDIKTCYELSGCLYP